MGFWGWETLGENKSLTGTLHDYSFDDDDGDLNINIEPSEPDRYLLTNPLGGHANANGFVECEVRPPGPGSFESTAAQWFLDPIKGLKNVITVTGTWVSDKGHRWDGTEASHVDPFGADAENGKTEIHPIATVLVEHLDEAIDAGHSTKRVDFLVFSDDPKTWLGFSRPTAPPHSGESVTAHFSVPFPVIQEEPFLPSYRASVLTWRDTDHASHSSLGSDPNQLIVGDQLVLDVETGPAGLVFGPDGKPVVGPDGDFVKRGWFYLSLELHTQNGVQTPPRATRLAPAGSANPAEWIGDWTARIQPTTEPPDEQIKLAPTNPPDGTYSLIVEASLRFDLQAFDGLNATDVPMPPYDRDIWEAPLPPVPPPGHVPLPGPPPDDPGGDNPTGAPSPPDPGLGEISDRPPNLPQPGRPIVGIRGTIGGGPPPPDDGDITATGFVLTDHRSVQLWDEVDASSGTLVEKRLRYRNTILDGDADLDVMMYRVQKIH